VNLGIEDSEENGGSNLLDCESSCYSVVNLNGDRVFYLTIDYLLSTPNLSTTFTLPISLSSSIPSQYPSSRSLISFFPRLPS
jgi:hypothetical protein